MTYGQTGSHGGTGQFPSTQGNLQDGSSSVLRPTLAVEARGRGRDEAELLHALTRALEVLVNSGAPESALRASFAHAMAGLAAEKGMLIQVRRQSPLDLAILHAGGLCEENADSIRALRSSPGISPTLIRKAIESGESCLMENSAVPGLYGTASLAARPSSVLCVPVAESLTGAVVAVLYFENEASRPFAACDLAWLSAYATALGQALTLHVAGERRILELEAEWRRARDADGPDILGESEATRELVEELNLLLPSTARPDAPPILVTGESGTGKELVARYLHHYSARRCRGPFQAFNCAGLRGELAESKLFGHVRAPSPEPSPTRPGCSAQPTRACCCWTRSASCSFGTVAAAASARDPHRPAVGDTRGFPVDVQIVAATNRKLARQVARGAFREDLYYRLSGLEVELVPLRDARRLADVRPLLGYYIARHERALQKKTMGLTRAALAALLEFAWPGNVRQLSNVCLSLVTHARARRVDRRGGHRPAPAGGPDGSAQPRAGCGARDRAGRLRRGPARLSQAARARPAPPARRQRGRGRGEPPDLRAHVLPLLVRSPTARLIRCRPLCTRRPTETRERTARTARSTSCASPTPCSANATPGGGCWAGGRGPPSCEPARGTRTGTSRSRSSSNLDPELLGRLREEVRAAQALATPYLVQTYSLFDRGTIAWFEMEVVEGPTLQQELDRLAATGARIPLVRAYEIALAVEPLRLGRAPARRSPPRHQAGERAAARFGPASGQAERLRDRAARRRLARDAAGRDHGHAALCLAGEPGGPAVGPAHDVYGLATTLYALFSGGHRCPSRPRHR